MERCCCFIDDLCQHNELEEIFPSSISLIPPGVALTSGGVGIVGKESKG